MTETLAAAMCRKGLTNGFAEVRRLVSGKVITVNGELAIEWNQLVHTGDVIKCGKYKTAIV